MPFMKEKVSNLLAGIDYNVTINTKKHLGESSTDTTYKTCNYCP